MTSETPSANPIEAIVARTPQLGAVGDDNLRMMIASLMMGMNLDFNTAESRVLGVITNAPALAQAAKDRVTAKRTETEKTFTDSFHDLILEAVKATPKSDLPMHGFSILVEADEAYKNPDGSPMMDSANNPVRGPLVTFDFRWTAKGKGGKTASDNPNIGRPVGDYLIEGDATVYKSLKAVAVAKFDAAEFETYIKGSGASSRKFLTDKGYVVPESPVTDADGKAHWILTLKAA